MSDRYEITGKLGSGGIGTVYRAYDTQLKREVALKRLLPQDEKPEEARKTAEHLIKEAGMLSKLQHPNIVHVYDVGIDDEGGYIVMELIDGETLNKTIKRGALTLRDFSEVVEQALEGMICAQEVGMLHRDLKPSNLMIRWLPSGRFQLKLLDFGLAKVAEQPSLQTLDHGDSILGSIYFMSPEQLEREPLDGRTDLYSLGCLFYYSLAGRFPFTGQSAAEVMVAHLEHNVETLHQVRPDIPSPVSDWVMKMMARDMDDRPEDATAALESFVEIRKELPDDAFNRQPGAPASAAPPHQPATSTHTRTRKLVTGTAPAPVGPRQTEQDAAAHLVPPHRTESRSWIWLAAISGVSLLAIAWFLFHDRSEATVGNANGEESAPENEAETDRRPDPPPTAPGSPGRGRPLVPFASAWKYHPPGSPLPEGWADIGFDDSDWPSGAAPIGYGDPGLETTIDISAAMEENRKPATLHFRKKFRNDHAKLEGYMAVKLRADDGMVIFLNGTEVRRVGLPAGRISDTTLTVRNVQNARESQLEELAIRRKHLRLGDNVIAIRLHQCNRTSSDAHFDIEVRPWGGVGWPQPPESARPYEEVVPTSRTSPVEWSYRLKAPSPNWIRNDYNEDPAKWVTGAGIFASEDFPKYGESQRTVWDRKNLWIRREFELTEEQLRSRDKFALSVLHDDDVHIYINGFLAASRWPSCADYIVLPIDPQARKKLKAGSNVLAVHCLNGPREQAVDVGIVRLDRKR